MEVKAKKVIFIIIEMLMNIICVIISPKSNAFFQDSGLKKFSYAILFFGCLKFLIHLIKLILSICYENDCCYFSVIIIVLNYLTLIIISFLIMIFILKLNSLEEDRQLPREFDKMIGMVVLYGLSYIFSFIEQCCGNCFDDCCKDCFRNYCNNCPNDFFKDCCKNCCKKNNSIPQRNYTPSYQISNNNSTSRNNSNINTRRQINTSGTETISSRTNKSIKRSLF